MKPASRNNRDYTYIEDILTGVIRAIDRPFDFEVINLGGSETVTLKELIRMLEEVSGMDAHIEKLPSQPGDVEITYADIEKAGRLLDFHPQTPIGTGLRQFLSWFEETFEVA